ncbi:MAG: hypothetical protein IJ033_03640 [Clostridia bacterium]|nr:hypothetical protein [Clostridia bacterium]
MAAKKQQTKVASTGVKRSGAAPRPVRGGAQYANPYAVRYNAGMPAGARRPQQRPAQPKKPVEKPVPVKKNKRRERDYFFIMRRGVCFFIMLLAIVWVGVFAMNYLGILPEYTSFLVQPDLTPLNEREDVDTGEVDEDGFAIVEEYVDKSAYVSFIDPIFGALKNILGVDMGTDESGESLSAFYDGTLAQLAPEAAAEEEGEENADGEEDVVAEAAPETEEETGSTEDEVVEGEEGEGEEATEEEEKVVFKPQVSTAVITDEAREADGMSSIAGMAWTYFPIVLVAGAVVALIAFLLALLSLFGRRIYKGFGLMSIIMLLAGVVALVAGLAASGNYMGNPMMLEDGTVTSVIDFGQIMPFVMGVLNGAPATAIDPETTTAPLTMVAGYGLIIIVAIPVVMLILSFFARKKVPYSIFDK